MVDPKQTVVGIAAGAPWPRVTAGIRDPVAMPWMADGGSHTRVAVEDGDPHRDPVEELKEAWEQCGDHGELKEAHWEQGGDQ